MTILMALIYILGAAILNRYRGNGGAWGPDFPHSVKRVIVSVWLALVFVPVIDPGGWSLWVLILMIWLIGFVPGWGDYFDLSDSPRGREVAWIDWVLSKTGLTGVRGDMLGMSLRGLHFTVPVAGYFALSAPGPALAWYAACGLLMGPVYYWMKILRYTQDRFTFDYIAASEVVWGGALAVIYLLMRSATSSG